MSNRQTATSLRGCARHPRLALPSDLRQRRLFDFRRPERTGRRCGELRRAEVVRPSGAYRHRLTDVACGRAPAGRSGRLRVSAVRRQVRPASTRAGEIAASAVCQGVEVEAAGAAEISSGSARSRMRAHPRNEVAVCVCHELLSHESISFIYFWFLRRKVPSLICHRSDMLDRRGSRRLLFEQIVLARTSVRSARSAVASTFSASACRRHVTLRRQVGDLRKVTPQFAQKSAQPDSAAWSVSRLVARVRSAQSECGSAEREPGWRCAGTGAGKTIAISAIAVCAPGAELTRASFLRLGLVAVRGGWCGALRCRMRSWRRASALGASASAAFLRRDVASRSAIRSSFRTRTALSGLYALDCVGAGARARLRSPRLGGAGARRTAGDESRNREAAIDSAIFEVGPWCGLGRSRHGVKRRVRFGVPFSRALSARRRRFLWVQPVLNLQGHGGADVAEMPPRLRNARGLRRSRTPSSPVGGRRCRSE